MLSASLMKRIWTLLRYPHPPLNQSSYTIFSFHRLAGFLPHLASYFFWGRKPLLDPPGAASRKFVHPLPQFSFFPLPPTSSV